MKVAILTQPLGHNYGGLLQAYALQTYLRRIGCEVEILDRRAPSSVHSRVKSLTLNLLRLMMGRIKSLNIDSRQAIALSELTAFRESRLGMSPTTTSEQAVRDYYRKRNFDAYVVGSDQVWRPRYSPSILNFYLDFLNDIESPALRIAYAASFGVDSWEYTDNLTKECRDLVKQFDAISVRETSALQICKDKLGISAKCVVDPTLLLDPKDYDTLIKDCKETKRRGGVLAYILDSAQEKRVIANMVGDSLNVDIFSIKPELSAARVRAKDLDKCRFPSVETWLQAFRNASYVVTDSFHGTVFSILFNKPFISVGNTERGMARFESLLSQFGLTERLVETCQDVSKELILSDIDWVSVNSKRKVLASEGKEFLHHNLLGK